MADDPLFTVRDNTVLIAGAGGGLGRAIAGDLARRGARLALFDIDKARLDAVAADCPGALAETADVTREADVAALVDAARRRFGRLDAAINAAGLLPIAAATGMTADSFRACIDVNLTGAFILSRVAAAAMKGSGGRIVHLASVSSLVANENYAAYASSKAGLAQLVRVLAREWVADGITVNAIGPAMTETPLTADYLADPGFRERAVSVIPMGRLGRPEDLLGAVVLLLAPGGAFITGQTIYVDGGRTLV